MTRRNLIILIVAGLLVVATLAVVADRYFLPEGSDQVDEDLSMTMAATVLKSGTFVDNDPNHHVGGTVDVIEMNGTHYLRFQDYEQTSGPDVFIYLTEHGDTEDPDEVESGLRVLIDGGRDGGESTKEGNFLQRLPDGFDPALYEGVTIWCDQFNQRFGYAVLAEP